jgi:hypothetical protein
MYTLQSDSQHLKPRSVYVSCKVRYHYRPAWRRPYSPLHSCQNGCWKSKLSGALMYISLLRGPFKYAVLTLSWCSSRFWVAAVQRTVRIESHHAMGANVKVKSWPGIWVNPLATSQALKHAMCPCLSRFMCKTHLHCTGLRLGGRVSTSSYMPLALSDSSSSCIAESHSVQY